MIIFDSQQINDLTSWLAWNISPTILRKNVPILEYGNIIWDNCDDYLESKVEKIQKRAARIITGAIIRTPTEVMYKELGWESLKVRRKNLRLQFLHKIIKNETPSYLGNVVAPLRPQIDIRLWNPKALNNMGSRS